MASAVELLGWMKGFLDRNDYKYEEVERENRISYIRTIFTLNCKLKETTLYVFFYDGFYKVSATITHEADDSNISQMAEFIVRANDGLNFGKFTMDFSDGAIEFDLALDCEDREFLSDSLISSTFSMPLNALEKYGDGLMAVLFAFQTPEQAVAAAEAE